MSLLNKNNKNKCLKSAAPYETHFEVLVITVLLIMINFISISKSGASKLVQQVRLPTKPELISQPIQY